MLGLGVLLLLVIATFIAGIVALIRAIGRSQHPRIGYAIIAISLTGIILLIAVNLAPKPRLRFSATAPVPSSLTMYFVENNLGSGTTTHAALTALHVKNGSPRFVHTYPAAEPSIKIDVLSDNVLFTKESIYINSTLSTVLRALRPNDGTEIWEKTFSGSLYPSFSKDGVIYVTRPGDSESVYALNESDGSEIWERAIPGQGSSATHGGVVAYDNGIIYLPTIGIETAQGTQSYISALRASDGTVLWQSALYDDNRGEMKVVAGIVFFQDGVRTLYALRGDTGAPLWQADAWPSDRSGFTVANGIVYASQPVGTATPITTKFVALRMTDGKLLWQLPGSYRFDSLQFMDGIMYLIRDDPDKNSPAVNAFRADDGTLLWQRITQDISWLLVNNGIVYSSVYTHNAHTLLALRAHDGSFLWQQVADGVAGYSYPIVSDGVIILPPGFIRHYCFWPFNCDDVEVITVLNATTGALYWRYQVMYNLDPPALTVADAA